MKIILIIPAYNEENNIKTVVDNLITHYPQYDYIVINDGSTDKTAEICKKNNYNLINLPINLGLSGAFQAGMKYALYQNYDYAIQYDGDGQHNPEYIQHMYEIAEKKNLDIVIGSRFIKQKKSNSLRELGNSIIDFCIYITTGKKIKDSTSGMRMFNKKIIKKLATMTNYGPEPDTIAFLLRCGAKIEEYPVHMNERIAGESYLSFSKAIRYMYHMCISIAILQWMRKKEI